MIENMSKSPKPVQTSKIMCVSHIKDVDGCVCAALVKHVAKSHYLLANYGNVNECLRSIYDSFDHVYVCDMGINETTVKEFERIRQFAELTYIDHHPLDAAVLESIQNMGVNVIHSHRDCASVLTYDCFKEALPREAGLLASYAAVSDRLENGPLAKKIMRVYDRDFVLFETMLLVYAIERADVDYKKRLIPNLSKLEYPHLIPDIPKMALEQAGRITSLRKELPERAQNIGNLFYADSKGDSSGVIANLLLDICDAAVGIGYNTNEQTQISDLSIRGADRVRVNLGKKTAKLARNFGGTGGGHPKASGARIPALRLMEFLQILSNQVK